MITDNIFDKKSILNKKWKLKDKIAGSVSECITKENQSIERDFKYFWPKIEQIPDLDKAIEIVTDFIISGKKVGIVGDYDVDGTSATALLVKYFTMVNCNYIYKIPNRFTEGYGLSIGIVKYLLEQNVELIITVDNGTTAYEAIDLIKSYGKKIMILDHHSLQLPIEVDAFVNPRRNYIYDYMCAAGVVFVFLAELNSYLFKKGIIKEKINMNLFLDIVATATMCDVVPLVDLNRAFVHNGLTKINTNPIKGFQAILGPHIGSVNAKKLAFNLGPFLNAPGRFGCAEKTIELLITDSTSDAIRLSIEMSKLVIERREIESKIINYITSQTESPHNILFYAGEHWHEGVLGIVAGRIKDKYAKSTCIMSIGEEYTKGSFRSMPGFHIGNCIKNGVESGVIKYGGGHEMAGGATIENKKIKEFGEFLVYYEENFCTPPENILYGNAILSLSAINRNTYNDMQKIAPFGTANEEPIFIFPNCYVKSMLTLCDKHCLFTFTDPSFKNNITSIVFDISNSPFLELRKENLCVHLAGQITVSNKNKIQLNLIDAILV